MNIIEFLFPLGYMCVFIFLMGFVTLLVENYIFGKILFDIRKNKTKRHISNEKSFIKLGEKSKKQHILFNNIKKSA